ncbi:MAG TPA: histidine--tRNA ligase [Clostridiales bacterium]|nr:histidine--tRNA ligase [Clostridiales bacterium]
MLTKAPKGTKDVLPQEAYKWHYIEDTIREIARAYGYQEIRTPVFEHTELFERGVGDTTDIVQKEMYTFLDKGERSITLKPEGTAGAARAYIEHKLYAEPQPVKMYYITPCYRYERPQAGRLREFHQFGVEVFGAPQASVDVEIITMAMTLFTRLGIKDLSVKINSIGCPNCRPVYHEILKSYLAGHLDELCETCKERYEKNPLRILDCKVSECQDIIEGVPHMLDHLCEECSRHFEEIKRFLEAAGFDYTIDPMIVRGLDYYTKTVFEIISGSIGAQGTICGGGRYDGLVEECGGPQVPGVGFGLGLERLLLAMEKQGVTIPKPAVCDLYFATIGEEARVKAFELIRKLRDNGISCDMDHIGRSLKSQFKYADKLGARFVGTLGDEELASGQLKLKEMATGKEETVAFGKICEFISA